ncbi:helix-turn-helix transcriptional regulator [Rickettsiales endosymbiont of Stachyamoeba lipophora]|uniref:helix-turn-helix transcriptional regulator n=1 Tax=Rickettsiales endosymbiont of Stachyamoeba lipophora TaxID=2486578 RepID=UPI000F6513B6|nr:AlpA family phage regulatory protein [Rickettsiales endosymbiont of Stachyamoeba lipophora]AZL15909.1 AlpA family phage regulatory protein [Rickettsiales endosymbiont of Stachyamoeba lipophora]
MTCKNRCYIPEIGYIRLPIILQVIPVGKSTWWAGVKAGRFPQPVKLGPRITAWRAEDITALINKFNQEQGEM